MNRTRFAPAHQTDQAETPAARESRPVSDGASPFLAQYLAIKEGHRDHLLFFRMGDFYELFFEDAAIAAGALDIALTRRGRHQGADIPMCGVPVHAADSYLARLIRQGHKVAICEQVEDPAEAKKRGSKTVVRRAVLRIVTPGTLSEESLLEAGRHNYLAALARTGGPGAPRYALAWADISTGDCHVAALTEDRIAGELSRIRPGELLLPEALFAEAALRRAIEAGGIALTALPAPKFDSEAGARRAAALYGVSTLDSFGRFSRAETAALGALLDYVALTQKGAMPQMKPPVQETPGGTLLIDPASRTNLELVEGVGGGKAGSLLAELDQTCTGAGLRLLREQLLNPSTDPARIGARLDGVQYFFDADPPRELARAALRRVPDLARALQRLALGRGGPRDLGAIRDGLFEGATLADRLSAFPALAPAPAIIASAFEALRGFAPLVERLSEILSEAPPLDARDGGFVRAGYDAPLDELRALRDESRRVILGLEERYRTESGVPSLKIRHNNMLGYFIEVTPAHAERMLSGERAQLFIHRQTLVSGLRFSTAELSGIEQRIAEAAGSALERELAIFHALRDEILAEARRIGAAADALARLDVAAGLAQLARERGWTRPAVTDGRCFRIKGGRHPMVEAALLAETEGRFVPNDCDLSDETGEGRLWLVTGPNMAGKSTFLRQNALIAILAQMGSYVPAESAEIGIVDRLFSRVGAGDDLARGRSTFMVEMVETAAILNQAGGNALVILDEIGRGTATFDGLSIAWATLEHLHDVNKARGLFATHYHELTALAPRLSSLKTVTMRVREWQGDVVFLHEVVQGQADRSYGIHVAKLAGLPPSVIARAETVLEALEAGNEGRKLVSVADDLPLFTAALRVDKPPARSPVLETLRSLNPDELAPREALDILYQLWAAARAEP
jgi:DNA mismatch repair protein MutS